MAAAFTLRNLPPSLSEFVFKKILEAHQLSYLDVIILPSESGDSKVAHVLMKKKPSAESAVRRLQECEIGDCIIATELADESVESLFLSPRREKPIRDKKLSVLPNSEREETQWEKEPFSTLADEGKSKVRDNSKGNTQNATKEEVPFSTLGLSPAVFANIQKMGFANATPIQALAIPPALEGCDLIGRAQTGTGKTLAFMIPIVERLLAKPDKKGLRALVLAPTRELAVQIKDVVLELIEGTELTAMVVYGGENILAQMLELRTGVQIVIATPGRLLDLQGRGRLRIDAAEIFVLDEADRMTDMGFLPQIKDIFRCFYDHPQTMLFSATMPKELRKLTGITLKNPIYVDAGAPELKPLDAVTQEVLYLAPDEKDEFLFKLLDQEKGPIIVFVRTRRDTERLAQRLKSAGYSATRIHGDIEQSVRMRAIEAFRNGKYKILVATDVAARGLDIEGVTHVVNYDLPEAPEDHLHRIGRTARAGATGKATTFVTHHQRKSIKQFRSVLGQS